MGSNSPRSGNPYRSFKLRSFDDCLAKLGKEARRAARKAYVLWRRDHQHPSLDFKKLSGTVYSVRVDGNLRAFGREDQGRVLWFWIGDKSAAKQALASFRIKYRQ